MLRVFKSFLILFLFGIQVGYGQIRLEIVKLPKLLIPEGKLFLASDLNGWSPGDPAYAFRKDARGIFYLELPDSLQYFEYKITQGSWTIVEGNKQGGHRSNRVYDVTQESNPKLVQIQIDGWKNRVTYRFVVEKIPTNTPHDATLYIAGNFNNWNPRDESYRLRKQYDGTYRISVYSDEDPLSFKFTRGNWESVEGKKNGKPIANRNIKRGEEIGQTETKVDIEGWQDIPQTLHSFSIFDILLLCAAFNGFLLAIVIPTIQNNNRKANKWLVLLLLLTSLIICIRVLGGNSAIDHVFPQLLLLPDFIFFSYAPLFYFYVQNLLFDSEESNNIKWLHFSLVLVQLVIYLPFLLMDQRDLMLYIVNNEPNLELVLVGTEAIALGINGYYWLIIKKNLKLFKDQAETRFSYEENLNYLNSVMIIQAVCLGLWLFTALVFVHGKVFSADVLAITEKSQAGIWLIFSATSYLLGYFAVHQPEVFKLPEPISVFGTSENLPLEEVKVERVVPEKKPEEPIDENLLQLKQKLETYMERHQPYTNSKLTLNELAVKLKIQPYILSRVINEGYNKNFFDFINTYRIEEFKKRLEIPRFKNYTLLAIAFEVGFNSKSAFNRSFKRITNQSPSEYFNLTKEDI
ncbi:helix-turn-helix domain-containing protein [Adhaeribacter aquaticus]|uniref:helix-turn-helix domain-containing protein n=1 Tax=Adhaeribacter aquaticus TaxID=299567 RepID=UPI0004084B4E|nr:helix-turn-helix domain-containing protein [Adhaeribacter aquaticus]